MISQKCKNLQMKSCPCCIEIVRQTWLLLSMLSRAGNTVFPRARSAMCLSGMLMSTIPRSNTRYANPSLLPYFCRMGDESLNVKESLMVLISKKVTFNPQDCSLRTPSSQRKAIEISIGHYVLPLSERKETAECEQFWKFYIRIPSFDHWYHDILLSLANIYQ